MHFNVANVLAVALALCSGIASALTDDQQAALDLHNDGRSFKKYEFMTWDRDLEKKAYQYAKELVRKGKVVHSGVPGENLYWVSAGGNLTMGAKAWMDEKPLYKGQKIPQGNFHAYGHYTQCMWKTTSKVGIAGARDSKGGLYVVARYDPAGNVVGQKV